MNWIVPVLSIYLAVIEPGGVINGIDNPIFENKITTGIILFDHFGIENDIEVYMDFPKDSYFRPYQVDFTIRGYLVFDSIEFGYQHECFHPLEPRDRKAYSGGYDKIYLKYEARFD